MELAVVAIPTALEGVVCVGVAHAVTEEQVEVAAPEVHHVELDHAEMHYVVAGHVRVHHAVVDHVVVDHAVAELPQADHVEVAHEVVGHAEVHYVEADHEGAILANLGPQLWWLVQEVAMPLTQVVLEHWEGAAMLEVAS